MGSKLRRGILASICMLILILDSKTALESGAAGLQICIMQVIPALLPFFVLSLLISSAFTGADIPLFRPLGRLCKMPAGSETLLILGLLGGYPAGAQGVSQAYYDGQLSKEDANRLLGFCSNAGPAFLFGIGSAIFVERWLPWALWLIHMVSAVLTGYLLPGGSSATVRLPGKKPVTLPEALERAIQIMAKVCGWIVLFRVLQGFLDRWLLWAIPSTTRIGIIGMLELANGCLQLTQIGDVGLRALLCSGFLALGGICVTMQTVSVTGPLGLGMYIPGKVLQCTISMLMTVCLIWVCFSQSVLVHYAPLLIIVLTCFLAVLSLVLLKYEKSSSNPCLVRV